MTIDTASLWAVKVDEAVIWSDFTLVLNAIDRRAANRTPSDCEFLLVVFAA